MNMNTHHQTSTNNMTDLVGAQNMNTMVANGGPNYYQHYAWVSPRDLVKDARKATRARGIFPSRIATARFQFHRTMNYTHNEIVRTTANFAVTALSMMSIVISLAAVAVA